jgi:glycosyltransferase involved in cell wall biosynthesis
VKVLVEVISAEFGGIRTYVENLLEAWARARPEDELLVVVPKGAAVATHPHARREVRVPRPGPLGRPVVQTVLVRRIARDFGADAILATLPSTTLVRTGIPTAVVVYDLRHELRPEQFTLARRLMRGVSYHRGYAVADAIVAISQRTLDDLHRLHPRTARMPGTVVHLGADHVLDWPGTPGSGPAVTFAHHTNKNPDLVLDAWADGARRGLDLPSLLVLGTGAQRDRLTARVAELGLADRVELAGYLPDDEFRQALASASMVVFPSDFEGFGLPVVEGMLLGIPVVIGPEPATLEVAGGHAAVLDGWSPGALADAVRRAAAFDADHLERARVHAQAFTWTRCVEQTRDVLLGIAGRR